MSATKSILGVGRKGRWLRLADRRIRTKLTLLVALPVVLVLLLTGYTALTSLSATAQIGTARQLVDAGTACCKVASPGAPDPLGTSTLRFERHDPAAELPVLRR
jgi:hypothetical protein